MQIKTPWLLALSLLLSAAQSFAATVAVDILDFEFKPKTVTVNLGDTVKWTNKGQAPHTSTSDGGAWDSGFLSNNQPFSRVFNQEGTFKFHCKLHSSMTGTVVVRSPEQTRIQTGQDLLKTALPGVSLNLSGKSASLAYLGSYIVNAQSACANCHSCPTYKAGANPYRGQPRQFNAATYLAGGVKVPGVVSPALSANLTPDAAGRPAGLTLSEFKALMRTGHDPDVPGALLQGMPWPFFGMMSERDLGAVYEFLRAVPRRTMPAKQCANPGQ